MRSAKEECSRERRCVTLCVCFVPVSAMDIYDRDDALTSAGTRAPARVVATGRSGAPTATPATMASARSTSSFPPGLAMPLPTTQNRAVVRRVAARAPTGGANLANRFQSVAEQSGAHVTQRAVGEQPATYQAKITRARHQTAALMQSPSQHRRSVPPTERDSGMQPLRPPAR